MYTRTKDRMAVYVAARRLIEQMGWCQNAEARNATGNGVPCETNAAVCFCASGAIQRAARTVTDSLLGRMPLGMDAPMMRTYLTLECSKEFARILTLVTIPYWNDKPERTRGDVIAGFTEVIAVVGHRLNIAAVA